MSLINIANKDLYLENISSSSNVSIQETLLHKTFDNNKNAAETNKYVKTDENEYQEINSGESIEEIDTADELDLKAFKGKFKNNSELDGVLAVFGHSEIFDALDDNNDRQISADELEKMGLDSDISKLTADDIRMIAKKAGIPANITYIDEEDYPASKVEDDETKNPSNEAATEENQISENLLQKLKDAFKQNASNDNKKASLDNVNKETSMQANSLAKQSAPATSGGRYYNTGNNSSGYSSGANNIQNSVSKPDAMSMEQLLAEQAEKQNTVNNASKEFSDVQNGTNENISSAKEDELTKKEDYEKKLKEDKNVSKKLKDDQAKIEKDIANKEKEIKEKETAITKAENEIYNLENTISNLDTQIGALNSSLGALPAKTEENKNRHAEIDAKKAEIEGKIKNAETEKKKANEEKTKLENQKKKDEKELEQLNTDLEELKLKRDEIEQKILDNASEDTKLALEEYQKARENVEKIKTSELQAAQKNLDNARAELDKINASINELQSMQMQLENRVGSEGEDVVEFAQKLDGLSAAEMKEIMRTAGCQFDDGAWCADFVTYVTKQVYGNDATPGDFAKSCSNTAYCPTIMNWAQQNGVWTSSSNEVQPGDYIIYNRNGRAGHIGIVTSVNPDGSVNTVEGNTSDDNGRYTAGVVNQHHNVTSAMGYVLMSKFAA